MNLKDYLARIRYSKPIRADVDTLHELQLAKLQNIPLHNFPLEYEATCEYHQTSPNSIFTKNRIISRLTKSGRVSLDNDELIVTKNGQQTRSPIHEDQRAELLKEHFGVIYKIPTVTNCAFSESGKRNL